MTDATNPAGGIVLDRRLRTPRSAAVAGVVFSLLLGTSYILIRLAVPSDPSSDLGWLETDRGKVTFAAGLVPFAGISFLWFMGVIRDRIGEHEDRFFATVLLGSGLLFLAMTFVASAISGGLVATYDSAPADILNTGVYTFGRNTMYRIANVYAIKMASVFMISLGTIWLRTRTMPRVFSIATYASALVLMISISHSLWIVLVFPAWVGCISMYILVTNRRLVPAPTDPTG